MSRSSKKIIDIQTVRHLAGLSRLRLTAAEEERLATEMGDIVKYFAIIDRAKVDGLEPSYHAVEMSGTTRGDESRPQDPDAMLRLVPSKKGRQVKAPRVF